MKLAQFCLSRELFVANIRASYYNAVQYPLIHRAGLTWYERARQEASEIAKRHRVSLECAIGVISALSPRNPWEYNLVATDVCLRVILAGGSASDFKVRTYNGNKEKAVMIAKGEAPTSILSGSKTRDFYQNILEPSHKTVVVLDGHALHVALGKIAALEEAPSLSDKCYHFFADCYRQACLEINADSLVGGILPSQVQAVAWQYYRVLKGYDRSFELN